MYLSRIAGKSNFWIAFLSLSLILGSGYGVAQDTEDKQEEVDLESLLSDARNDIGREDFAAAAKKLKQVTEAQADNGIAWQLLGYSLHLDGKLDEAIVAHTKATEFPDFKQLGYYNLGCAYSLKKQPKKALEFLHIAMDNGFDRFEMFETDADLEHVKKSDGFKEILARAKNGGKRPEKMVSDKSKFDVKSLVGEWAVTAGTRQAAEIDPAQLPVVKFTKKDVTIPAGDTEFVMSFKVVKVDKGMVELDFNIESGPAPEGTALGIMKVAGNKAKLCYDPMGQNRPKEFKTTEENGFFMFELEKKGAKFDPSKILGQWNVTEGMRAGETVPADRLAEAKITFEKNMITIPAGEESFIMSYEINADAMPIEIDMEIDSGPAPEGSAALGILKFEDGNFVLCYNAEGGDRPKKFESTSENGNFLFTMKADK